MSHGRRKEKEAAARNAEHAAKSDRAAIFHLCLAGITKLAPDPAAGGRAQVGPEVRAAWTAAATILQSSWEHLVDCCGVLETALPPLPRPTGDGGAGGKRTPRTSPAEFLQAGCLQVGRMRCLQHGPSETTRHATPFLTWLGRLQRGLGGGGGGAHGQYRYLGLLLDGLVRLKQCLPADADAEPEPEPEPEPVRTFPRARPHICVAGS